MYVCVCVLEEEKIQKKIVAVARDQVYTEGEKSLRVKCEHTSMCDVCPRPIFSAL